MNVLITGGAGFLGCNLVRACLRDPDARVTVLDSLDPHFLSSYESLRDVENSIRFVLGDLRDEQLLAILVKDQDVIFSCAAQTSHMRSIREPRQDVQVNCAGVLGLLEAVRRGNPEARVIYPSSSTVIGKAPLQPVDEDCPERPLDIYSADKCAAEHYHHIYHSVHGLHTAVIRFANLYGPYGKHSPDFGFINYFIGRASAREPIHVFGGGRQVRNVMHVEDAAAALRRAAECCEILSGTSWFATGDEHMSVLEIAEAIAEEFAAPQVECIPWPPERKPVEIGDARFSSQRFRTLTGWRPAISFPDGLRQTRRTMEERAT